MTIARIAVDLRIFFCQLTGADLNTGMAFDSGVAHSLESMQAMAGQQQEQEGAIQGKEERLKWKFEKPAVRLLGGKF